MFRPLVVPTLLVSLSGCFDGDLELAFEPGGDVVASVELLMDSGLYGLMSSQSKDKKTFCPDGQFSMKSEQVSCVAQTKTTVAELIETGTLPFKNSLPGDNGDNDEKREPKFSVERLDEGVIRISVPLSDLKDKSAEDESIAEKDAPAFDVTPVVMAMVAGHGIRIRYKAMEIIETNGEVSDDRTTASIYVPLAALMEDSDFPIPDTFVTTLRYEKASCAYWVFC